MKNVKRFKLALLFALLISLVAVSSQVSADTVSTPRSPKDVDTAQSDPAAPDQDTTAQPTPACYLLDDPTAMALMSSALETKLKVQCGLLSPEDFAAAEPSESISAPAVPQAVADAAVSSPGGDIGQNTTQSETSLAVRPSDERLCAGWNDSQHYAQSPNNSFSGYGYSTNGGTTWVDRGALPPIAGHTNFGDPAVEYRALDNRFYYATLDSSGLALHVSTDGCVNFNIHYQIHTSSGDDKELMAIDNWPSSPHYGRIYIVWKDFSASSRIYSTYSDNGSTWSTPVAISTSGVTVQGAWPTVAPNGDVYVSWVRWNPYYTGPIDIEVVRSTNGGVSYTAVTNPLTGGVNPRAATPTSTCGRPALNGNIRYLPAPAIEAGANGYLHVVYTRDPDGYNTGDVINAYYRRSTNNGASWGPEIQLNDVSTNDQFYPTVVVDRNGTNTVAAYWYDRRNSGTNFTFQMYKRISQDGGATWGPNILVSDVASSIGTLIPNFDPVVANCYMGDYNQGDANAGKLYLIWSDNRNTQNGHPDPDVWFEKESVAAPTTGTLYYDWSCDGSYSSVGITFNDDGTFSTGSSGKWVKIEGMIIWQYNSSSTTYTGDTSGKGMGGIMSTFSGLQGCWYVVTDTPLSQPNIQQDPFNEMGEPVSASVPIEIPAADAPTPLANVVGTWTLYYSWGCTSSYSSTTLTINSDGTFSTGSTGKWNQLEGMIVWKFDNLTTAYGGNVIGRAMAGLSTTFNGLNGCWYALKTSALNAPESVPPQGYSETGEALSVVAPTGSTAPEPFANVVGTWNLYYSWSCTGSYSSTSITLNSDGTFTTSGYTGKWKQLEGKILWQFDGSTTTYEGNVVNRAIVGLQSTFSGLQGCWYAIKSSAASPDSGVQLGNLDVTGKPLSPTLDEPTAAGPMPLGTAVGTWTLYFDWSCDGSYSSTTLTINSDGTFSTGSTGKWNQVEGMTIWKYNNITTAYGGNLSGNMMTGISTTFTSLQGCWYAIKSGTMAPLIDLTPQPYLETGEPKAW